MNRRYLIKLGLAGMGAVALTGNGWAMKFYPMPTKKKWAILYGTWCGSSRDAALWISEGMAGIADVFDVRENPDLKDFDHIVIGGSIRSGVTSEELQSYIQANQVWLKEKICGYFAVCGNMRKPVGPEQTNAFITNHLAKMCGSGNLPAQVFLGRITKSLMDERTAAMMAKMEDYDNLKRPECMEFGKKLLAAMN